MFKIYDSTDVDSNNINDEDEIDYLSEISGDEADQ